MPKAHKAIEPWVKRHLGRRFPELVPPLMAAVDAFDAIQEKGKRPQDHLGKIVKAVSSNRRPLYENACEFMQKLTAKWPEAAAAVLKMSKSPKSHVRFNAILCLGKASPSDLVDTIIRRGLQDRSARVRSKAADWAGRLGNTRVIPELTAALASEKNKDARSTINFELCLLRDGYILEKWDEGWLDITVRTDSGGISGELVEESRLKSEGIQAIIAGISRDE